MDGEAVILEKIQWCNIIIDSVQPNRTMHLIQAIDVFLC